MKLLTIKIAVTLAFGVMTTLILPMPISYATDAGPATACELAHPIIMVTTDGTGQNVPTNRTMTVTFIGPITNVKKLAHNSNQAITVCEGGHFQYDVVSTVGSARCTLNKRPIAPKGTITVRTGVQRFMCTNKPEGNDVDRFQIMGVIR